MNGCGKKIDELNRVHAALQALSPPSAACNEALWPKTRQIAELCDINIYISRYCLMKLVKDKKAYVSPKSINNSLRWYIAEPAPLSENIPTENRISTASSSVRGVPHDAQKKHFTNSARAAG